MNNTITPSRKCNLHMTRHYIGN